MRKSITGVPGEAAETTGPSSVPKRDPEGSETLPPVQAAGVFDEVIASLDASEKNAGWADKVAYNRKRMARHGLRRAAEMEESAKTLQGLGVEPVMTRGTVELQRRAAKRNRKDQAE